MKPYETLQRESPVPIDDQASLPNNIKGLYIETTKAKAILINKSITTSTEKHCMLAEELGHYYTSCGNIIDQSDVLNRKHEKRARNWAYNKLIPLDKLVDAYHKGVRNRYELADYLDVTEEFLQQALQYYQQKYGIYASMDRYVICFEPLGIVEKFK